MSVIKHVLYKECLEFNLYPKWRLKTLLAKFLDNSSEKSANILNNNKLIIDSLAQYRFICLFINDS